MKPIERFLRETDRVPLMPMPTPLHPMHYQPSGKNVSLLIKRDDMTGVGPGGNKIRSLEFLLGEARSKGASKILAAGPEQSNLCALTAAACAKAGLDCELIINAAEPARKEGNLLLEELLGTKIHFLGPCDGAVRNRRMEEGYSRRRNDGRSERAEKEYRRKNCRIYLNSSIAEMRQETAGLTETDSDCT